MGEVIHHSRLAMKRLQVEASERFERGNQALEKHTRDGKCCEMVLTGSHPEYDTHLCLRKKDHQGYHMDKTTGFNWKWT